MAIRLPGIDDIASVGVTRDPGVRADADAFGAQIGRAQQQAGAAIQNVAEIGTRLAEQRREAEDKVALNTFDFEYTRDAQQAYLDAQAAAPAGGEGFQAGVDKQLSDMSANVMGRLEERGLNMSRSAREAAEANVLRRRADFATRAMTYEHNARIEFLGTQHSEQAQLLAQEAYSSGDPEQAIASLRTSAEAYRGIIPEAGLVEAQKEAERAIVQGAINGLTEAGRVEEAEAMTARFFGAKPQAVGEGFEAALVQRESGGRPGVVNKWGYAGLYQFGAPRMADLGIYNPGNENLSGWSKRTGGQGKWTGTFNIPGFPEVKKLPDFLANPAAQRKAFEIHRARMDQEITRQGLEGFIGQTVGGVQITRDGIHAMMHLGGAGGAARALKSGGKINAADANGTTLLAYAKMGTGGGSSGGTRVAALMPDADAASQNYSAIDTARNQRNAETRASIQIATDNAPTAIMNTGRYENELPTAEQFLDAYGSVEGASRYAQFQSNVEVSRQAYDFRTMPADAIQDAVRAAQPTASGDTAVLDQQRYETLSKAAEATITAREADPVAYTRQAFPHVDRAWQTPSEDGNHREALAATADAQAQLGIKNPRLMPTAVADNLVERFKNEEAPEAERIGAMMRVIFSTDDPDQQKAVFDQLVEAGLPEITEGAVDAAARGDEAAARRLFQAAMVDPSKLPGKSPETPANIDAAVQASLMDVGQIGDVYYGLSDGTAENFVRAQRDQKLIGNAVQLRLRSGEGLNSAIDAVAKDLYGDVRVSSGNWSVNAQILIPQEADEAAILGGLERQLPNVRTALEKSSFIPPDAPVHDGTRAVIEAARQNYIEEALSEGYFRNADEGFVFILPKDGEALEGADGEPLVFMIEDAPAQERPIAVTDEDREQRFIEDRATFGVMGGGQ